MEWKDSNKTIAYMIFGFAPVCIWGFGALIMAFARWEAAAFALLVFSAIYALFVAATDDSPAISVKRFLIIAFLLVGIKLMLPITFVYTIGLYYNDATINIVQLIFMLYLTLCPVIVALHYILVSIIKIASNKSSNLTGANDAPSS